MKTFRYRLKSKNLKKLNPMVRDVNFVWNYCNETSIQYLDKFYKWLSGYDLCYLTAKCSKSLSISAQSVQAVAQSFAHNRNLARKRKLAWRSNKRTLGWIPFNGQKIKFDGGVFTYSKIKFHIWYSRPIEGRIKSGSFSQDSKGNWYLNLTCETIQNIKPKSGYSTGIDLGLKTIATLSNGIAIDRKSVTNKYADKLAKAQRARKKRQVLNIHSKISNTRKDWNHKITTQLVNQYDKIIIGNVNSSRLVKTRMAKSVSDASWFQFKSMLAYKAIALGVEYKEVNEMFSTVTCSACLKRTGPRGLSALGVREWKCSCGASHDRDVNAAKNILRIGLDTPIKGSLIKN